jgi:mercuric ion transport protein
LPTGADIDMNEQNRTRWTLAGASSAALLASACCVGPLILVSVGIGGAWIGNLRVFEPYQPVFIAAAAVALFAAHRRLFRAAVDCRPGAACALPANRWLQKTVFWFAAALVLIAAVFPYLAPLFY